MNLSLRMTMIMGAIFGAISLAYAVYGFVSLGEIADPAEASDARGFVCFWALLGSIAVILSLLAWWIERSRSRAAQAEASSGGVDDDSSRPHDRPVA